jgi:hypothetical protein
MKHFPSIECRVNSKNLIFKVSWYILGNCRFKFDNDCPFIFRGFVFHLRILRVSTDVWWSNYAMSTSHQDVVQITVVWHPPSWEPLKHRLGLNCFNPLMILFNGCAAIRNHKDCTFSKIVDSAFLGGFVDFESWRAARGIRENSLPGHQHLEWDRAC